MMQELFAQPYFGVLLTIAAYWAGMKIQHKTRLAICNGMLLAVHEYLKPNDDEPVITKTVRFRTVGDVTCTGCVESEASTVEEVIAETAVSRLTERGATRADDRISEAGMEDRKREGYF